MAQYLKLIGAGVVLPLLLYFSANNQTRAVYVHAYSVLAPTGS